MLVLIIVAWLGMWSAEKLSRYPIHQRRIKIIWLCGGAVAVKLACAALVAISSIWRQTNGFYTEAIFWIPVTLAGLTLLSIFFWGAKVNGAVHRMRASVAIHIIMYIGDFVYLILLLVVMMNIYAYIAAISKILLGVCLLLTYIGSNMLDLILARSAYFVCSRPLELTILSGDALAKTLGVNGEAPTTSPSRTLQLMDAY